MMMLILRMPATRFDDGMAGGLKVDKVYPLYPKTARKESISPPVR